jgi:protein SERAC1
LFVFADQDEDDTGAIDIVALHGLNGNWERTWQHTTKSGGKVLWLRDFLPKQIPHARIMSLGYNSVLQFSKSVADIGTFAEQLLAALVAKRRGRAARRHIIFVCHSLGGIVVKKVRHENNRFPSLY